LWGLVYSQTFYAAGSNLDVNNITIRAVPAVTSKAQVAAFSAILDLRVKAGGG